MCLESKKEQQPKEKAAAPPKAAAPAEDEDDDGLPKEPKSKDPLDDLPKGLVHCLILKLVAKVSFVSSERIILFVIELGFWMTSNGFIPTMKSPKASHTSGKNSILKIIPSGIVNTSMLMSFKKCL